MTAAVWFRNDLRSLDHRALSAACASHGQVRGLYLLCPQQLDEHIIAPIRRHYLRRSLDELGRQLGELGIPFDIVESTHFNNCAELLVNYCSQHQVDTVYAHQEWLLDEMRRDDACITAGAPLKLIDDSLLSPLEICKGDGGPYKVFTPFAKRCRAHLAANFPNCLRSPKTGAAARSNRPCPRFGQEQDSSTWAVQQDAVLDQLRGFCAERAEDYRNHRDFPELDNTSHLSAALALGLVSPRQCLARLQQECGEAIWDSSSGAGSWLNELLWREFYRHVAYHFPRVVRGRAFQAYTEQIPWPNDPHLFAAWCEGRTGYPIVDAGMRQLKECGWMHNRLRMITASFLCKDLHIDWRWGERYFLENLIDADFCSNNGGWQWAASTGTDAAPYFRIFNPTTQGQRFDPKGEFIKRYLPELSEQANKALHQPMDIANYPAPIVEHQKMRQITLALFKNVRD